MVNKLLVAVYAVLVLTTASIVKAGDLTILCLGYSITEEMADNHCKIREMVGITAWVTEPTFALPAFPQL